MTKEIFIITKNIGKIAAANKAFSKFGVEVKNIDKDYPEIQASSSLEIAKFTAIQAAKELGLPVLREDHSLFITALGGFPGPYTSYFDKKIPAEKILELLKNQTDRSGFFEVATVYAKPSGEVKEYVFRVPIRISEKLQGSVRNWDRIIMLEGETKTFAELDENDHLDVWNKNYLAIAKEIIKEKEK